MTHVALGARVRELLDRHFHATPYSGQPTRGQEPVTDETALAQVLIDALDMLEVILTLEEAFDVELDHEKVAQLETVGQLAAHVASLLPARAAAA